MSLQIGSKGQDVVQLQQLLAAAGFDPGTVDGIFGSRTKSATMRFQQAHGLAVDGVVGTQTWTALAPSGTAGRVQASLLTTPGGGVQWITVALVAVGAVVAIWMFSRR